MASHTFWTFSISYRYLATVAVPKIKKAGIHQILINPGSKRNEGFIYLRIQMEKHITKNEHSYFAHNQGEKLRAAFIKISWWQQMGQNILKKQ